MPGGIDFLKEVSIMAKTNNSAPLWSKNFITVLISHFFLLFGFQALIPTIPLFASTFSTSETFIGLVAGVFTISAFAIRPISGSFLDRKGRRMVLALSLITFIASAFSYTLVTGLSSFLVLRFIHGLGWGSSNTASDTVATDNIPLDRFGEGMGYFGLSMTLGMVVGLATGMFIATNFGFNTLFYVSAFLVLLSLLISSTIKYEAPIKKKEKEALFVFDREALEPALLMSMITISYGTLMGFIPLYAQQQGIANTGPFFTVYALAMLITRPFLGRLIDSHGFDYTVLPGISMVLVSMALVGLSFSLGSYLLVAVIYGTGFGSCLLSFQTMAIKNMPPEKRGGANAVFYVGFDGGMTLGSILFGYIASQLGYSNMYLITLIPAALALLGYLLIRKNF